MSTRKLQQEFDKTNKKISEGLSVFDDIHEKLMTTEISSQKEKLESDLKKEIKKLQRLRDQLKTWLNDNSIKLDKNLLQENRTRIEHAMDQFKDLEKSSKIKQFSNEGLELQSQKPKFSRHGDSTKKAESANYLGDIIGQIEQQNEALEQELHLLSTQLKKTKASNVYMVQSSVDDCRYKIERNNNHLSKLERILTNVEYDKLAPERIDDIKDDLEYYVENNQDEDYVEYDDFYEQLDIDDDSVDVQTPVAETSVLNASETVETDSKQDAKSDIKQTPTKNESKAEAKPETKISNKPESTKFAFSDLKPEKKIENKISSASASPSNTPKKNKVNIVPAPNPPPLNNENSYSNIIKAAQASAASPAQKVSPPGLNNVSRSKTASPQIASQRIASVDSTKRKASNTYAQQASQESRSESLLPVPFERKEFFATATRLAALLESRLHNPLPFQAISQLLESSLLNCPDSFDAEKVRQYNPIHIHPSSIDYPQEPMYELNSSQIMKKFDNDTLFFCFYYNEGIDTYSKWNAARELSRRGWLFNNETKQWFFKDEKGPAKSKSALPTQKGDSASKQGTPEPKEENYKYFDYERTWLIRRKDNFEFKKEFKESFV